MNPDLSTDCVIPFLFEALDIRGAWVSLDATWAGLTQARDYPEPVANLLGEMCAVSTLIAASLKQPGRMTFQLKGDAAIDLLVLDCDEQLRLRGMARLKDTAPNPRQPISPAADIHELLGNGNLLLSLDTAGMQQPYQSLVALEGDSIAAIFEQYLNRSEQQPTRLVLAVNSTRATGLFLQTMPDTDKRDADGWNRIQHLLQTLLPEELLSHPCHALLQTLFPEEDIRVYAARPVTHHCPKDWEKIHTMLRALGRSECDAILQDHSEIHVRDDICNHDYRLGPEAVAAIFETPSTTLH
jgi:molecular chaperone Hsp33